jgi:hypothetical protein
MIDQAEANAVEPANAPEQILIDPFIGEKIHYRLEVQTERLDGDQMTKSLDGPVAVRNAIGSPASTSRSSNSACLRSNRQWEAPVSTCASSLTLSAPLFRNTGNEIPSPAGR